MVISRFYKIMFVGIFVLALQGRAAHAAHEVQLSPPMGWNSYDVFGDSVTEAEVLANAKYMQKKLLEHGWNYVVVDFRWYDSMATYNDGDLTKDRMGAQLSADKFGRLLPAPNRFPSSAGGKGFKPLADKLHAMGLKFGIHIMRGIPRQAVKAGTPIQGCPYSALDAGNVDSTCGWCPDMFGVRSNEAGQAWYDSIFRLYASWGVDFVKVDDLSSPYWSGDIEMIRKAIDKCGRDIVFSTSPGPTAPAQAAHIKANANMWRISGDFWDEWFKLNFQFELVAKWQGVGGPGHWPDADMIPFGHVGIRNWTMAKERQTRFTKDEQRTLMSLWALAPSPLMLGMNLPDNDSWTLSLLTNNEVIAVNQDALARSGRRLRKMPDIWIKELSGGTSAVGFFNRSDEALKLDISWAELGFSSPPAIRDLWLHKDLEKQERFTIELAPHESLLLKAMATARFIPEATPTPVPTPVGTVYQAEDAALFGGAHSASDIEGYFGTGFVGGFYSGTGQSAVFNVEAKAKGKQRALFRYGNGMGSVQSLSLVVNGIMVKRLDFPPLADWDSWGNLAFDVDLKRGTNKVALEKRDGNGCINLDYLLLP